MNQFKKYLSGILTIGMIATTLTGCGASSTNAATQANDTAQNATADTPASETTGTETDANGEAVTLTIAARGGSHVDVIEAVKGAFEQEHNVKIEVLGLEAADLKQKVALDAINPEGAYDLVMVDDPVMPEFTETGVLLDLTENGYTDDADFVTESLAVGKNPYATGDTYALPFSGNVQLFFYNDAALQSAGAEVPTSWEDVLSIAQTEKNQGVNGFVIRGQQGNPIVSDFLPVLWAYGGNVFDDNFNVTIHSQEAKDALNMYCELLAAGANYEKNDIVSSVSDGSSAMALGWPSWFISGADATASYAAIPQKATNTSAANSTGMIGNWMMGVPANTTHKDLAIELLTYLTSAETQLATVDKGCVPTRTSVFTDATVLANYPYFETIHEATKNSVVRPRTPKWSNIEEVFGAELSNAVSGVKTVDQALADSQTAIEQAMK